MQERARSLDGELTVESAAGKGTTVLLVVRRKDDTRPDM
jgi:signal transduction histidine kinase